MRLILPFVLAASGLACSPSPPSDPGPVERNASSNATGWNSHEQIYRCADGTELPVVYLNIEGGDSFATLYHAGRLSLLRSWPAASGARYVAVDEQHSLRWHTKNGEGQLSFLAADHTAEPEILLQDCRAAASGTDD